MKGAAEPSGAVAKKRAGYRERLLDAGEQVFAREGYEQAKMQVIAELAGLALGTVYSVFASKELLYSAIHERRGSALLEQAARAAASAGGPADALLIGVDTYVRYLASHPDYLRIHLAESQPWALDPRFQSQAQRDQWRMGKELTASVFRAAMAEGTVHRQDPELAARLMIAAHQVFLADWVESGMREPLGKLSRRMQEHVKRSFFRSPLGTARRAAD